MRGLAIILLILSFTSVQAQKQIGAPFITNYFLSNVAVDPQNWDIAQSNDELMLFANRQGILTFDGSEWAFVETPDIPYSIKSEPGKTRVFVGCRGDFGYLYKDNSGLYYYKSLKKQGQYVGNISKIELTSKYVYYYSDIAVHRFVLEDLGSSMQWESKPDNRFLGIIRLNDDIWLNSAEDGLCRVEGDSVGKPTSFVDIEGVRVIFSLPYSNDMTLVGTDEDRLFLFDGKKFRIFETEASEYLFQNVLSGAVHIDGNKIAFSTLTGGAVILNKANLEIDQIINYRSGIPDDELYAIGMDKDGGLWLAHEFGLSRVDMLLPLENYSSFPGLEGNLNTAASFNNTIYVATSEGVYYLAEVKNVEEVQLIVQNEEETKEAAKEVGPARVDMMRSMFEQMDKVSPGAQPGSSPAKKKVSKKEERKQKRKNFFENLFGTKKDKEETETEDVEEVEQEPPALEEKIPLGSEKLSIDKQSPTHISAPGAPKTRAKIAAPQPSAQLRNKKAKPDSEPEPVFIIKKVFKQVRGIEEKSKQLIPLGNRLLVSTNTGIYQVTGSSAKPLVKERYINFVYPVNNNLIYAGLVDGLIKVELKNGKWQIEEFDDIKVPVYSIFLDANENLWLGTDDLIFKLDPDSLKPSIKQYALNTRYSERILTGDCDGSPCFFTASGVYKYDLDLDTLELKATGVSAQSLNKYIFLQKGITWHHDGEKWGFISGGKEEPAGSRFLELFENIQSIYVDESNSLWVVDNNALYLINSSKVPESGDLNVFLKSIYNEEGIHFPLSSLKFEVSQSASGFKVAAPYFLKGRSTEFQYLIEGYNNNWSKWSPENVIDFQFQLLPPGKYTLKIRARNLLGELSGVQEYAFVVEPPFYQTWYFYSVCIAVAAGLIYLIVRFWVKRLERQSLERQAELELKVKQRTSELAEQKEKTEELLLNILPKETADELKAKGYASTKYYSLVSVLFTDFVGFTQIAENLKPEELVSKLDTIFRRFDEIVDQYSLEKIKTIGDSYMCAGGIPAKLESNPIQMVLAALEMQSYVKKASEEDVADGNVPWNIRVGIHTGPLTAGVVGKKKFAYDIWGDTVNIASRMESSGEPGEINISGSTYELIKHYFECEYRGKKDAKNKGKVDMYYVRGIKSEYAVNGTGSEPNDKFWEALAENYF